MESQDDAAEARRRARNTWPVRRFALGDEPPGDLCATTTPQERLDMVDALTRELWDLAGRESPTYRRDEAPVSRRTWPSSLSGDRR